MGLIAKINFNLTQYQTRTPLEIEIGPFTLLLARLIKNSFREGLFAQRDLQPKEPKSCGCVSQINCSNNTFIQLLTKLQDFEPILALRTNLQAS